MLKDKATRNLDNFLSTYTLPETTELLNQVFDHVSEGTHFAALNDRSKEHMVDFLEAIEELFPAVYEFHKWEDPLK